MDGTLVMTPRPLALAFALLLLPHAPQASARASQQTSARYEAGMVSAADPRAAEAGAQILRAGGSATDAALAVLAALTVVEPQSSGIGGGGFLVMDDGTGRIETIDGRETAPEAAGPRWFEMNGQFLSVPQAIPGGRSVGVPGNVALMAAAHRRHGKLAWRRLFQPAIRLARDGFAITPRLYQSLDKSRPRTSPVPELRDLAALGNAGAGLSPQSRSLFFDASGAPLPVGTLVRNPALAAFLDKLARQGPRAFYRGANARAIVAAVSGAPRNPAPMTTADIASYKARARPPVCSRYRGWRLCGMGPPSSGATTTFAILGMLERFDMAALGKSSPTAWHLFAEAQRLAYADRERYLADADFVPVPTAGLIDPGYLAARSQLIAPDRSIPAASAGVPPGARSAQADTLTADVPSTSHFAVVDRKGQVVSLTSTIEGSFGSGLMVNGYFLNNELTDFSLVPERDGMPVANRVEARKRPRSSMSPTLLYDPSGKLRMAIGAAGGGTIPVQVARSIIGVIDWKLTAAEAIALPVLYAPGGTTVTVEDGSGLVAMIPALQALGHAQVTPGTLSLKANAVEVVDGRLRGAADPRSEGTAISE
jgi:gamma-glutamyltranspeptidase/glutathione hydrolase